MTHRGVGARTVDTGDERRRADFSSQMRLRQGLFRLARFGRGAGDPQPGLEAGDQRSLKARHRQDGVRQQGAQGGLPAAVARLLRGRHVDRRHHCRQVEIDQRRALVHDDVIVEIARGAADLLPVHHDVGRRPVFRRDAEGREAAAAAVQIRSVMSASVATPIFRRSQTISQPSWPSSR